MSEEMVMFSGRIPKELKELIAHDPRDNQDILRAGLWSEVGSAEKAAVERRIDEVETRISTVKRERNERNRELEGLHDELETLQTRLETIESRAGTKQQRVDELLDKIADKQTVFPKSHKKISEVAQVFETHKAAVEAIQARAEEREDINRKVIKQ